MILSENLKSFCGIPNVINNRFIFRFMLVKTFTTNIINITSVIEGEETFNYNLLINNKCTLCTYHMSEFRGQY